MLGFVFFFVFCLDFFTDSTMGNRHEEPTIWENIFGSLFSHPHPTSKSHPSKDAKVWYNLGIVGGGSVKDEKFSETACFQKALDLDSQLSDAWYHLGLVGGGEVRDAIFDAEACLSMALKLDPENFVETTKPPSECMTTSSTEVSRESL